jgi:beta-N-acetylglucosaminidase
MTMINEELARRAKENMSFSDYKPGSATAEYIVEIERVRAKIEAAKTKVSPEAQERLDSLLARYKVKYANWTNAHNLTSEEVKALQAAQEILNRKAQEFGKEE